MKSENNQAKKTLANYLRAHEEKVRYLIVGGWNTVFGFMAFVGLYYFLGEIFHYISILTISYVASISNAYVFYKIFVFKTKGNYLKEYLRFYLVYGLVYAMNILLLPLFVEILKINIIIAQGIILFFTVVISYTGHKYYSFGAFAQVDSSED